MDKKNKSYQLGLYEKALPSSLSWEEKLSIAKNLGFDFIEISIDETDEKMDRLTDPHLVRELYESMKSSGLPIRSLCLSAHRKYPLGSMYDEVRNKGLEIFKLAVDFASNLGIRLIQLAGYDVYYDKGNEETKTRFQEYLIEGINYAASKEVMCGFETMETEFMNTVKKAKKYVDLVNSPYCQIYPDLGNIKNASENEEDLYGDIEAGNGNIVAVHLKETIPGVFREVEFNTGHVDFDKGIQVFWDQGVRSFVCECWYTGNSEYKKELKYNYKFLSEKINKASEERT